MTLLTRQDTPGVAPQVVQNSGNSCFPQIPLFPLFPEDQASLAYGSVRNAGFAGMYPEPPADGFLASREPLTPGSRNPGSRDPP